MWHSQPGDLNIDVSTESFIIASLKALETGLHVNTIQYLTIRAKIESSLPLGPIHSMAHCWQVSALTCPVVGQSPIPTAVVPCRRTEGTAVYNASFPLGIL